MSKLLFLCLISVLKCQFYLGTGQHFFQSATGNSFLDSDLLFQYNSDELELNLTTTLSNNYVFSLKAQPLGVSYPEAYLIENPADIQLANDLFSIQSYSRLKLKTPYFGRTLQLETTYFSASLEFDKPYFTFSNGHYFFRKDRSEKASQHLYLSPTLDFNLNSNMTLALGVENIPIIQTQLDDYPIELNFGPTLELRLNSGSRFGLARSKAEVQLPFYNERLQLKMDHFFPSSMSQVALSYQAPISSRLHSEIAIAQRFGQQELNNSANLKDQLDRFALNDYSHQSNVSLTLLYQVSNKENKQFHVEQLQLLNDQIFAFKATEYQHKAFARLKLSRLGKKNGEVHILVRDIQSSYVYYQNSLDISSDDVKFVDLYLNFSTFSIQSIETRQVEIIAISNQYEERLSDINLRFYPENRWNSNLADLIYFVDESHPDLRKRANSLFIQSAKGETNSFAKLKKYLDLQSRDLNYLDDPISSQYLEHTQHPSSLLKQKTGDCEDLVIFYANQLMEVGYECAILAIDSLALNKSTVGHTFLLVNTGLNAATQDRLGLSEYNSVKRFDRFENETIWIPIDVSQLSKGFAVAHQIGSELYDQYFIQAGKTRNTHLVPLNLLEIYGD
jgi:hypothetical protein